MKNLFVKNDDGSYAEMSWESVFNKINKEKEVGESISTVYECVKTLKLKIKNPKIESFMAMYLNHGNQFIKLEVLSRGVEEQTAVYTRDIIRRALLNYATGIIVAHNHPTDILKPSQADKDLTRAIKNGCDFMDLRLLDHIILGNGNRIFSFRENGLL